MVRKIGERLPVYFFLSILIILCVMLLRSVFAPFCPPLNELETAGYERRKIVLDAGHGGKDGGAVSVTGTHEKQLNLDISLSMRETLHILGYEVIMTRESDVELTHIDGGTRKMQDLKGRLEIATYNKDAVFVSIHMNKFSASQYSGLQVYYSPNDAHSFDMARSVQDTVKSYLQPENDRKIKKADSSIFLLHKITSPAILIECGFLSNENEAVLLDTPEYRVKLSTAIATAIINSFERQEYEN
ncbi:MAG: N-acetylmuramoyl-L-alanine amidase [Clostridia bacterium]|nr:N-acetylmuramoyl-L-alanine amidase [Clostridia bacterium]